MSTDEFFPVADPKPIANPKPMQPSEVAKLRRNRGTRSAAHNSGPAWLKYAYEFCFDYLRENQFFFCDDVWAAGLVVPHSPRAFGAVITRLKRDGKMIDSGLPGKPSANSNGSKRTVYRSLVCSPEGPLASHGHRADLDGPPGTFDAVPGELALDAIDVLSHFNFTGSAGHAYAVLTLFVNQNQKDPIQ